MPTLYGEGKEAFQRLQEALLSVTDDQTLLCFRHDTDMPSLYGNRPFAMGPSCFVGDVEGLRDHSSRQPMVRTNRGMELDVELCHGTLETVQAADGFASYYPTDEKRVWVADEEQVWVAGLDCRYFDSYLDRPGIVLDPSFKGPQPDSSLPPSTFRRRWGRQSLLRLHPSTFPEASQDGVAGQSEMVQDAWGSTHRKPFHSHCYIQHAKGLQHSHASSLPMHFKDENQPGRSIRDELTETEQGYSVAGMYVDGEYLLNHPATILSSNKPIPFT
jgi:hypothetical protein